MQDDIFNPYGIDETDVDDIFNSFDIDETVADYIYSCDLKKLQELKKFIERVEKGKLNCFLIENRKKWG